MSKTRGHYTIRQVIDLSGVSEFLLRAWETRYDAFKPQRTTTGRRLYSSVDVLKAKALMDLTVRGSKISEVAQLSLPDLKKLLEQTSNPAVNETTYPSEILDLFVNVEKFDWDEVRQIIFARQKSKSWIQDFVIPLLSCLSHNVQNMRISISQEHIISAYMKEALASYSKTARTLKNPRRIIFTTPENDFHELGLLTAAKLAQSLGHKILYLGPNMPKQDLADTCLRFNPTHLVIASTVSKQEGAKEDILQYLHFINHHLDEKVKIWLAGRNVLQIQTGFKRELKTFFSFKDYEEALK